MVGRFRSAGQVSCGLLIFAFFLCFAVYASRNCVCGGSIGSDYILGGDGMAHVYKVTELLGGIREGVYVDWSDAWYLGYHPYHFYSPLSYWVYALVAYVVNDVGLGIRIGLASSFLISSIAFYVAALEIASRFAIGKTYRHVVAIVAAIFYAYHPYVVNFTTFVGDLPAAFAFSFVPLAFFFYMRSTYHGGLVNHICCAFSLAGTFLAHPFLGVFAGTAIGLYCILRFSFSPTRNVGMFKSLFGICSLFLGLVAFWFVPYYYEQNVLAQIGGYEWTIPLSSVSFWEFFDPASKAGWSPRYLGMSAMLVLVAGLVNRKRIRDGLTFLFMLCASCYVALGVNAPFASLNPLLHLGVYPDRAMALCVFCLALGLASAGGSLVEKVQSMKLQASRKLLATGVCMLAMLGVLVDSSSLFPSVGLWEPDLGFNDVCSFIKKQGSGDGRVLFVGHDAPLYSYSPALTGRALVGGYYLQGSRLAYEIEYARSFALEWNQTDYAIDKYEAFNVEYVAVDRECLSLLDPLFELEVISEAYANDRYVVYEYLRYKGVLRPVLRGILVVGQDYPSSLVRSVLEAGEADVTVTTGDSPFVDDYSLEELISHEVLVLYSFAVLDKEVAEELLRSYVGAGKLLVIDMDGFYISGVVQESGEFMGVNFSRQLIYDDVMTSSWGAPFRVTYSELPVNVSFSEGAYLDAPWYAVAYPAHERCLLEINGYPTVVTEGNACFIGLNLFYHALLLENYAEIELLQRICAPAEPVDPMGFEYEVVVASSSYKKYIVNSTRATDVVMSIAWSPHLEIRVDDEPVTATIQNGLLRLTLPEGERRVDVLYVETPVHFVGAGVTLATVVLLVMLMVDRRIIG